MKKEGKVNMHKIELEIDELEYAFELMKLAEENEDIDLITEKNFTGDLTMIELYISLSLNVITLIVPIIKALIKQKRVSSLKIDGDKIEVTNVSQELIETILREKMTKDAANSTGNVSSPDSDVSAGE